MACHPALPHLPEMRRELIGFGPLFRGQGAIDSGERLVPQRRYLALQVGCLCAQLVDFGRVVRPDRLEHRDTNLFQLLADGLRGLADRSKLRFGARFLRRGQIQVAGHARAAIMLVMLLHGRLRRLAAHFLSGQEHTSRYRRCCCKT